MSSTAYAPARSGADFLSGGGEMGALIRQFDWAKTSLGPPHLWPQSLRTVVRLMLTTNHPIFVFWGADLLCLYNDAYRASLGPEKHPAMLGAPGAEMWGENWAIIGPQVAQVMAGGPATWHENHLVPIFRNGRLEDAYWTYSYSPIDDDGGVGGVLAICNETTCEVLAARARAREVERLHDFFRQTPTFVAMLSGPEHRFEFVNEAFMELLMDAPASAAADMVGKSVRDVFPEAVQQGFIDLLDRVFLHGEVHNGRDVRFTREATALRAGRDYVVDQVYKPWRDHRGDIVGVLAMGYDVSDRARMEAELRESERRYRDVVDAQTELVCRFEPSGRILFANKAYAQTLGFERDQLERANLWDIVADEDCEGVMAMLSQLTPERPEIQIENRNLTRDGVKWTLWTNRAIRFDKNGVLLEAQSTGVDITERKLHEEHRTLLIQELNHRVKNTLAVVQAVASQTFKRSDNIVDIRSAFEGRLAVLAAAHRCLTETYWGPTSLREVANTALAVCSAAHERVEIKGKPVLVAPRTALSVAMALHELCTNAVKYGALSNETGRVRLAWSVNTRAQPSRLRIEWREHGGPPVKPPQKSGFGSIMIQRALKQDLQGEVALEFLEEGVRCVIEADLDLGVPSQV